MKPSEFKNSISVESYDEKTAENQRNQVGYGGFNPKASGDWGRSSRWMVWGTKSLIKTGGLGGQSLSPNMKNWSEYQYEIDHISKNKIGIFFLIMVDFVNNFQVCHLNFKCVTLICKCVTFFNRPKTFSKVAIFTRQMYNVLKRMKNHFSDFCNI